MIIFKKGIGGFKPPINKKCKDEQKATDLWIMRFGAAMSLLT